MTLLTLLKILLMLLDTPGMIAPAATATKPAIRAYSIKSCPCSSLQISRLQIAPRYFIRMVANIFIVDPAYPVQAVPEIRGNLDYYLGITLGSVVHPILAGLPSDISTKTNP